MKLVYNEGQSKVEIGDVIAMTDDDDRIGLRVEYFRPPHKPSSSGKVSVRVLYRNGEESETTREYYVGVIGAVWIEREDRLAQGAQCELSGRNWT